MQPTALSGGFAGWHWRTARVSGPDAWVSGDGFKASVLPETVTGRFQTVPLYVFLVECLDVVKYLLKRIVPKPVL